MKNILKLNNIDAKKYLKENKSYVNFDMPIYAAENNPTRNIRLPNRPNKCIGRLPNFDKNQIVIKSRNPFMNRSIPNFVSPYFLA